MACYSAHIKAVLPHTRIKRSNSVSQMLHSLPILAFVNDTNKTRLPQAVLSLDLLSLSLAQMDLLLPPVLAHHLLHLLPLPFLLPPQLPLPQTPQPQGFSQGEGVLLCKIYEKVTFKMQRLTIPRRVNCAFLNKHMLSNASVFAEQC